MDLYETRCCVLFNRLLTGKPEENFSRDLHFPATIDMYMEWLVQHRLIATVLENSRVPDTARARECYTHCHGALLDMGRVSPGEISSLIQKFTQHKTLQHSVFSLNQFKVNMLAFEAACAFQVDHVVAASWIYQYCFHHTITLDLTVEKQVLRAGLLRDEDKLHKLDMFIRNNVWRFSPDPNFHDVLAPQEVYNLRACIDNMHLLFIKLPLVVQANCRGIRYNHADDFRQPTPQVIQATALEMAVQRAQMISFLCRTNHQSQTLHDIEAFFVACLMPDTVLSTRSTKQDLEFILEHHFPTTPWASSGVRNNLKHILNRILCS